MVVLTFQMEIVLFRAKLSGFWHIFYSYALMCITMRSHWVGAVPDKLTLHLTRNDKKSGGYAF